MRRVIKKSCNSSLTEHYFKGIKSFFLSGLNEYFSRFSRKNQGIAEYITLREEMEGVPL
jgi:hypothetical protein